MLDAYALIRFQNGARLVNFKQNAGSYFYSDTGTTDFLPAYFQFVPLTNREFVTYNFHLKAKSRINFQIDKNNRVTGLTFSNGEERISAKRIR